MDILIFQILNDRRLLVLTGILSAAAVVLVVLFSVMLIGRWRDSRAADSLREIDAMSGPEFEQFCASLMKKQGFKKICLTPGSGDQGVDITAVRDGVTYAVQCKRYNSPVGNTAVQEVTAGKAYYGCDAAMVITNSYFTVGAGKLAKANQVVLIDRDMLQLYAR